MRPIKFRAPLRLYAIGVGNGGYVHCMKCAGGAPVAGEVCALVGGILGHMFMAFEHWVVAIVSDWAESHMRSIRGNTRVVWGLNLHLARRGWQQRPALVRRRPAAFPRHALAPRRFRRRFLLIRQVRPVGCGRKFLLLRLVERTRRRCRRFPLFRMLCLWLRGRYRRLGRHGILSVARGDSTRRASR